MEPMSSSGGSIFLHRVNDVVQRRFDRAMRYQHSFWYRPAKEIFEEALNADPECAIAHWGIALGLLLNPHFPAPRENLAQGLAALEKSEGAGRQDAARARLHRCAPRLLRRRR
jgi:hypothetical protein